MLGLAQCVCLKRNVTREGGEKGEGSPMVSNFILTGSCKYNSILHWKWANCHSLALSTTNILESEKADVIQVTLLGLEVLHLCSFSKLAENMLYYQMEYFLLQ